MPSLAQLQAEPWWGREVVTGELDRLGDRLCAHFGRPRGAFGSKGDENHLRGAHRSQEWILNSQFCTNITYTVQSGLSAWQQRHIAGGDLTPGAWGTSSNRALMAQITKRLIDTAKTAGLPGVIEIGGTLDGRTPTGWHVVQRRTLSFDSSHLDHLHLTFDRQALESRTVMDNVFNTITGGLVVANESDVKAVWQWFLAPGGYNMQDHLLNAESFAVQTRDELRAFVGAEATRDAATTAALTAITEAIRAGGGSIEVAPILERVSLEASATRDLVEQRHAAEMAELSRVHATALAERDAEVAGLRAELERLTGAAQA